MYCVRDSKAQTNVGGRAPDPTPETKNPGNLVLVQRAILPQKPLRHERLGVGIPFLIVRDRPGIPISFGIVRAYTRADALTRYWPGSSHLYRIMS